MSDSAADHHEAFLATLSPEERQEALAAAAAAKRAEERAEQRALERALREKEEARRRLNEMEEEKRRLALGSDGRPSAAAPSSERVVFVPKRKREQLEQERKLQANNGKPHQRDEKLPGSVRPVLPGKPSAGNLSGEVCDRKGR